jgi:hypothetical protein
MEMSQGNSLVAILNKQTKKPQNKTKQNPMLSHLDLNWLLIS